MARRVLFVVIVAVLASGCGGDAREDRSDTPPNVTLPGVGSGELVDVGGRRLYVECIGSGSPTILLEAGFGGSSRNWIAVLPNFGRITRTCTYDRAGLGDSDAIPGVHDAGDEIRDLERLLERARIDPPYVLVGRSYGGCLHGSSRTRAPSRRAAWCSLTPRAAMRFDAGVTGGPNRSRRSCGVTRSSSSRS